MSIIVQIMDTKICWTRVNKQFITELLLKGTNYVKWLTLILFNLQNFSFNPPEVIKSFSHIIYTSIVHDKGTILDNNTFGFDPFQMNCNGNN